MPPIALYIHIPFCARKCAYCDFASYAGALDSLPAYLAQLEAEMVSWHTPRRTLASIYIGGGTPSLLSGNQMQQLMDTVRAHFALLPGAEISMEANPGTLDATKLHAYRAAGINRLSLGAQAMQPHLLATLGRIHAWSDVEGAVRLAREAGFENLNIDLMYALPGQTLDDWRNTLAAAIALHPEHISAYSLILEDGTTLTAKVKSEGLVEPDDDDAIDMQRLATRMLGDAGLSRYEISNYARAGFECRHNITYWTRGDYLGLGAAAHSLMAGERFSNTESLDYQRMASIAITAEDAFEERVLLGTRMVAGIDCDGIAPAKIARLGDLVHCDGRRLWLTERGMEVQNQVVLALLS